MNGAGETTPVAVISGGGGIVVGDGSSTFAFTDINVRSGNWSPGGGGIGNAEIPG